MDIHMKLIGFHQTEMVFIYHKRAVHIRKMALKNGRLECGIAAQSLKFKRKQCFVLPTYTDMFNFSAMSIKCKCHYILKLRLSSCINILFNDSYLRNVWSWRRYIMEALSASLELCLEDLPVTANYLHKETVMCNYFFFQLIVNC